MANADPSRLVAVLSHPQEVAVGLPWAHQLARQSGLPLTLLHIIDPVVNQEMVANARVMAEDMLAMLQHHPGGDGLDVSTRVVMGMPETVMSEGFAADPGIVPVLVAGSHGVFARRLLGRGNDHVIRAIRGPFVFLPPAVSLPAAIDRAIIGVPPDFDGTALTASATAIGGPGCETIQVTVYEPGSLPDDDFLHRAPEFEPSLITMRGRASAVLLAAARTREAGLIVLGSHGSGRAYSRSLGTTAEHLSTRADRPLLILPSQG